MAHAWLGAASALRARYWPEPWAGSATVAACDTFCYSLEHLRLQALDAELLWLRKELSLTKLELAQASGARDEAEHKLRTLVRETESETNEALGGF